MMFHKALLFNDIETSLEILKEKNLKNHKVLGRKIKNFDSIIWDLNKCRIVYEANNFKFNQNENLKSKLLNFDEDVLLIEASPYDKIWGVGMDKQECLFKLYFEKEQSIKFVGENLLGFILTILKQDLKNV